MYLLSFTPMTSLLLEHHLTTIIQIASSSIPHRSFSHTPQTASSPFRLNTTKTTTQDAPPELSPDGEPLEYYSPYKPKRQWPPDMTKLSPKHQFRLERKYRRRAALKFARPKWTKATKLVQWGVIGCKFRCYYFWCFNGYKARLVLLKRKCN